MITLPKLIGVSDHGLLYRRKVDITTQVKMHSEWGNNLVRVETVIWKGIPAPTDRKVQLFCDLCLQYKVFGIIDFYDNCFPEKQEPSPFPTPRLLMMHYAPMFKDNPYIIVSANEILDITLLGRLFLRAQEFAPNNHRMHNLTDTQRTPLSTCYSWHHDWLVPPRPLVLSTDGWNDPRWLNPTAVLLRETKLRLLTKDVGLDVYAEEQWKAAYASGDYSKVARLLRVLAE